VGWELLCAAARQHEVILLTQVGTAAELRRDLAAEGIGSVRVIPVRGMAVLGAFEGRLGLGHVEYLAWQYRAWRVARCLQDDVDVAHHVTFGNDWLPAAVHFLDRVPVVWGPVGGTAPVPWRLVRYMSAQGIVRELAREAVTRPIRIWTARQVRRQGCLVVGVNEHTAERFAAVAGRVLVEPHVAMPPAPPKRVVPRPELGGDLGRRAVFAARLSSWKGPYLALHTLALLSPDWRLDFFGVGAELRGLQRRARRLGLEQRLRFLGHRPMDDLRSALDEAHVLLFPSMHDASPFTVAEAVRLGCPVVCLDVGGPPLLIEGTTGLAVAPRGDVPRLLAAAVGRATRHPPSDRWSAMRLANRVTDWYDQAVALPARPGPSQARP
jgi:glycosyltransferase involved in cell wall biosynthesis